MQGDDQSAANSRNHNHPSAAFSKPIPPLQDHLLDVLRPNLPERSFRNGDILLRQGEQGTHLMYLLSGQVEVLVKLQPLRESR